MLYDYIVDYDLHDNFIVLVIGMTICDEENEHFSLKMIKLLFC